MYHALFIAAIVATAPAYQLLKSQATELDASPKASAVTKEQSDKEKKEKIDKANKQLVKLFHKKDHMKAIKEFSTNAIMHEGIHPDELDYARFIPLVSWAVLKDDFDFTSFLLTHGANPNHRRLSECNYPIEYAKTVRMAQLLFDHGAGESIANCGIRLLRTVVCSEKHEPALIEWCANHDIDTDQWLSVEYENEDPSDRSTLLLFAVSKLPNETQQERERAFTCIRSLMQLGGSLSAQLTSPKVTYCDGPTSGPSHYNNRNAPQAIQMKLYRHQKLKPDQDKVNFLNEVRNNLIATSGRRHKELRESLSAPLTPELYTLVAGYYEPIYEELEKISLDDIRSGYGCNSEPKAMPIPVASKPQA